MNKVKLNIILIISSFIVLVAGLAVVMVVAPGADILGLKYIRATSGSIDTAKSYYVGDLLEGDIVVNSDNILTKVNFVSSYSFTVRLVDVYNGYCKSDADPEVKMEIVDGIITFTSNEYHPFIYHNRSENSALYIDVPIYLKGRVSVNSKSSNVVVCGMSGSLEELAINTKGSVVVESGARLKNLSVNVASKKVTIDEKAEINGNVNIKSVNSNIKIACPVAGNINLEGVGGSLKFNSCDNLTVKASSTDVLSSTQTTAVVNGETIIETNDDITLKPLGDVTITTKRGKVTIGEADGEFYGKINVSTKGGNIVTIGKFYSEVSLSTSSGDISISWLKNAKISTVYGQIDANRIDSGIINAGSSNVTVLYSAEAIKISTRGGKVVLGAKDKYFDASADIKTLAGDITVINAKGDSYTINTDYGVVNFEGTESNHAKVKITAYNGQINALNLCNETTLKCDGKINAIINSRVAKTVIEGGKKEVSVRLKYPYIYTLRSAKANNIYINGEVITGDKKATESVFLSNPNYSGLDQLTVTTKKGKITIQDK